MLASPRRGMRNLRHALPTHTFQSVAPNYVGPADFENPRCLLGQRISAGFMSLRRMVDEPRILVDMDIDLAKLKHNIVVL